MPTESTRAKRARVFLMKVSFANRSRRENIRGEGQEKAD
jgi:hypothetical protein